ncbi:MAG: hypothetical protein [Bacteriophage sp.]|nr:MAG: hypothetical protein [Bacteriophage sp.]
MSTPLKQIFDLATKHVKFDAHLANQIKRYVGGLMNSEEEHVLFFGSNLTGCYNLRFKTSDRNTWMIDIMDIDEFDIRKRVLAESVLDPNWVRANDVFNLDCLYTVHRFLNSSLSESQKRKAIEDTFMALNIKLLGSIMAAYFKFKCDERVAQEVYARLSRKFYIKKYGSWRAVLEKRSADTAGPDSKWLPILTAFTDDEQIAQCISDIQGRLRSMIKYVWEVFSQVRADDARFNRTSMSMDVDGTQVLQDLKRDGDRYIRYAQTTVLDRNSFIKPELIAIVDAEMRTMSDKLLVDALEHTVVLANRGKDRIDEFVDACVRHTVEMIQEDRSASRNMHDISWLINKEKLLFMAPKTSNAHVFTAREISEKIIRQACKTKNPTMIASLKTGLIIYIIARAFTMRHYTS